MFAEKYHMPFLDTAWELGLHLKWLRYITAFACLCLHDSTWSLFDNHKYQMTIGSLHGGLPIAVTTLHVQWY